LYFNVLLDSRFHEVATHLLHDSWRQHRTW